MRPDLAPLEPMTIDDFLVFTEQRPEGERWELIEGVAVMSPSATEWHQVIAANIVSFLLIMKSEMNAPWLPMLGVGTRVPISPNSLPQPDVFVKEGAAMDSAVTDDALVLFEVLSRSNTKADQAWRRHVYASVPNCAHYMTVSARKVEVVRYDRAADWRAEKTTSIVDSGALDALGVTMPLADIYRWTPLAGVPA